MKLKSILLGLLLFLPQFLYSQSQGGDFLRNIGSIYVVVAVLAIIFLGIIIFLIVLDKRAREIEKQIRNHES